MITAINQLPGLINYAAAIAVIVLAVTRIRGAARTSGLVGGVLLLAAAVLGTLYGLVLSAVVSAMGSSGYMRAFLPLLVVENLVRAGLIGAALIMLARCVVISGRQPFGQRSGQPQPPAYGQGGPAGPAPGDGPAPGGYGPGGPGQQPFPPYANGPQH